jgi:serine protease AprX
MGENHMNKLYKLSLFAAIIIILALVLGPSAMPVQATILHAQSELVQLADRHPEQQVSVIVQKSGKGSGAEEMVTHQGGTVTKDLYIINAFVAQMSAKAAMELARQSDVRWVSLDSVVQQSEVTPMFVTWATATSASLGNTFSNAQAAADSAIGPNNTYASGATVKGGFNGFSAEVEPGYAISKVEVVLRLYTPVATIAAQDPVLSVFIGGKQSKTITQNHNTFATCTGQANACTLYIDITSFRTWSWADFNDVQDLTLYIDQSKFKSTMTTYYDAVGLRVTSSVGTDTSSPSNGDTSALAAINAPTQGDVFNQVIRSSSLWDTSAKLQGKGVTIAVVDSGIVKNKDIDKRVRGNVNFNPLLHNSTDLFGHGTFVAGIIAGNGSQSSKKYMGVAPRADLLNVRVSDDQGMMTEGDVISALQWVNDNRSKYNIRIVNLSLNSTVEQSYNTSPLDAACEILWFNSIVVVVSAGNTGTSNLYAPANDPFVITVGATDDKGTVSMVDDTMASFSSYGMTENGSPKPDLVAPGKAIIGLLPNNNQLTISSQHSANRVDNTYFKMSGTSVSAPMVSGAIALLLQDEPNLTPDQVKYRLMATANKNWPGYDPVKAGAGYLDIYAAVYGTTTQNANTSINVSNLLTTGSSPVNSSVSWNSVSWNSVSWNSVSWNSVSWNSVSWNSVSWNSDYWGN